MRERQGEGGRGSEREGEGRGGGEEGRGGRGGGNRAQKSCEKRPELLCHGFKH